MTQTKGGKQAKNDNMYKKSRLVLSNKKFVHNFTEDLLQTTE